MMTRAAPLIFMVGLGVASNCFAQDENSKRYDDLGSVSNIALMAIEAAKPEFLKQTSTSADYTIDVIETDNSFLVTFCLKSQEQTVVFTDGVNNGAKEIARWPRCPGSLTVELSKKFDVVRTFRNRD